VNDWITSDPAQRRNKGSHRRDQPSSLGQRVTFRTPPHLVTALSRIRLGSAFNPYADRCPEHDRYDAAHIRRRNLVRYLKGALDVRVDTMWIARDVGYRSGRRTGLPITDELRLERAAAMMGGVDLDRATLGPAIAERTSTVVWDMLGLIGEPILLWNAFPLHLHEAKNPFSNRGHTRAEPGGDVAAHPGADRNGTSEENRGDRQGRRGGAGRGRRAGARRAAPEPRLTARVRRWHRRSLRGRPQLIVGDSRSATHLIGSNP